MIASNELEFDLVGIWTPDSCTKITSIQLSFPVIPKFLIPRKCKSITVKVQCKMKFAMMYRVKIDAIDK